MSRPDLSELRLRLYEDPMTESVKLFARTSDEGSSYVIEGVMSVHEPGRQVKPLIELDMRDLGPLQSLADQLWEMGVRPKAAAGSSGQLAATEAHLADMRRLGLTLIDRIETFKGGPIYEPL